MSLAHSILQMKNKDDVFALKEKSQKIYEKLSLLAFVEEFIKNTPNLEETKEELVAKVAAAYAVKEKTKDVEVVEKSKKADKLVYNLVDEDEEESQMDVMATEVADAIFKDIDKEKEENFIEQPFEELEKIMFSDNTDNNTDSLINKEPTTPTLEDELEDTIPVDVMADLFENAQPISLNDKLSNNIQIGLNDRIAFVKNLFDGSQEDFNRVISQLNSFKTEKEAKKFINKMVKPDYNWSNHEELETRFLEIVVRKFA